MKNWRDFTDNPNNKWVIRGWPINIEQSGGYKDSDCPIIDFVEGNFMDVHEYAMKFSSFVKIDAMGKRVLAGRIQKFTEIIGMPIFDEYMYKEIKFKKV